MNVTGSAGATPYNWLSVSRVSASARGTLVAKPIVASTTASLVVTLRAGVREVRVIGSLVAYRLEQETGRPADPALVKRLTVSLYLSPRRTPSPSGDLPLGRLVRKWVFRSAIGKDTRKAAWKALDAVEQLDVATLESRWRHR